MDTYPKELYKWIMNEGKRLEKIYKCWPLPEVFGFAIREYVDGRLNRKETKYLLEDMFRCASQNERIQVKF